MELSLFFSKFENDFPELISNLRKLMLKNYDELQKKVLTIEEEALEKLNRFKDCLKMEDNVAEKIKN